LSSLPPNTADDEYAPHLEKLTGERQPINPAFNYSIVVQLGQYGAHVAKGLILLFAEVTNTYGRPINSAE
jgi:hypothetical protein